MCNPEGVTVSDVRLAIGDIVNRSIVKLDTRSLAADLGVTLKWLETCARYSELSDKSTIQHILKAVNTPGTADTTSIDLKFWRWNQSISTFLPVWGPSNRKFWCWDNEELVYKPEPGICQDYARFRM